MIKKKILRIEENKKDYTLYLEHREKINVSKETYFKYSLYELTEIDDDIVKEILFNNDIINCETAARKKLTGGSKSSNRLFLFLQSKGFNDVVISLVISKLEEEDKINDINYAKKLIKKKLKGNKISSNMLISILINEGLKEETVIKLIEKEKIDNYKNAKTIVDKKFKGQVKDVEKIYRYLLSKGFERDVIFAVLGKEI